MSYVDEILDNIDRLAKLAEGLNDRVDWDLWNEESPGEIRSRYLADEITQLNRSFKMLNDEVDTSRLDFGATNSDALSAAFARSLLDRLRICQPVDEVYGLDYWLAIVREESLVTIETHPDVISFLVRVGNGKDAITRESEYGYHFHHIDFRNKKRTGVLLTFNPTEPLGPPDSLHWEHHGRGSRPNPDGWGFKRRRAIHGTARSALTSIPKSSFRSPSQGAHVLFT